MKNVLARRNEIIRKKKARNKIIIYIFITVFCCCALFASLLLRRQKDNVVSPAVSPVVSSSEVRPPSDTDGQSGTYGAQSGIFIPCVPFSTDIVKTGEEITDSEAALYFESNRVSLFSALEASGVNTSGAVISEKGYCHVSYDGVLGKPAEVRLDFRDYPVFSGSDIIAIVTLYKIDGVIYSSPAFGAPWFGEFSRKLSAHRGEALLFIYAAQTEIVIAPDGSYLCPIGYDVSEYLAGISDPYGRFYCPEAVFVPN